MAQWRDPFREALHLQVAWVKKAHNISVSAARLFKHSIIYEDFPLKINDLWPEEKQ